TSALRMHFARSDGSDVRFQRSARANCRKSCSSGSTILHHDIKGSPTQPGFTLRVTKRKNPPRLPLREVLMIPDITGRVAIICVMSVFLCVPSGAQDGYYGVGHDRWH